MQIWLSHPKPVTGEGCVQVRSEDRWEQTRYRFTITNCDPYFSIPYFEIQICTRPWSCSIVCIVWDKEYDSTMKWFKMQHVDHTDHDLPYNFKIWSIKEEEQRKERQQSYCQNTVLKVCKMEMDRLWLPVTTTIWQGYAIEMDRIFIHKNKALDTIWYGYMV